ncbi:MAG TPA: hypothetical protein VE174_09640, partial [Actinomycetota bacterium]|nr:hypothetical protein [Actinomycetota bacterium]
MKVAIGILLLALLGGCSDDAPESVSARVLVDFEPYTFVEAEPETAANLREFITGATPADVELVDATVRSVLIDGERVPAEVLAAAYDGGDLTTEDLQLEVFKEVAPGSTREILGGRGVLINAEGTALVAAFPTEDVLIYLVGSEGGALQEIATGI